MKQSKNGGIPGLDEDRNVRVNGDGFGVGWYNHERISAGACTYRCITPAWNNHNLKNLVKHTESYLILGHIRAVRRAYSYNAERKNEISEDNCHPFVHGRYSFMHNGCISHFSKLKRSIREGLPDHLYNEIIGTTDSEHLFAMLLQEIGDLKRELTVEEMGAAVENTINRLTRLSRAKGYTGGNSMNIVLTDGRHMVATRCRTTLADGNPSLYYCVGTGGFNTGTKGEGGICIASEPMTDSANWIEIPCNTLVSIPYVQGDARLVEEVNMRPLIIEDAGLPLPLPEAVVVQPEVVVPAAAVVVVSVAAEEVSNTPVPTMEMMKLQPELYEVSLPIPDSLALEAEVTSLDYASTA
jgi:glutamine amidotransferase